MRKTRENNVEAFLRKKLSKMNVNCYKIIPDNCTGLPDRLVTLPNGRCIWVELKTDGGALSEIQKYRHRELREQGQEVAVVWSKEEADKFADWVGNIIKGEVY